MGRQKKTLEDFLNENGFTAIQLRTMLKNKKQTNPIERKDVRLPFNYERNKFLVMSDLHMGHKNFREDILDDAVQYTRDEKCEFVLIPGDILEGMSGRDGHIYELSHLGATKQMDYAVEQLSKFEIPVYGMTATNSHDGWYSSKGNMGYEVGPELERRVKNFKFLGYDEVDLEFGKGIKARMVHPGDGTAYAMCFDDRTEIMTDEGWKFFKDLNKNEKVLTLNKDKQIEFQKPFSYTNEEYEGELLVIDNPQFNLAITPNHRMFVKRPWNNKKKLNNWEFIEANKIKGRQWKMLKTFPNWEGNEVDFIGIPKPQTLLRGKLKTYKEKFKMDDWLEFIGWFLSEGNLNKSNKQVEISQDPTINTENYNEIIRCLERMGYKPYCYENKIRITSLQLFNYLLQFGLSHEKFIPKELKNLSKRQIIILLDALYKGDGCFNEKGQRLNYTTNSKQLADDIQELNHKLGYACTIKKYDYRKSNFNQTKPIYQISIGYNRGECEFGGDFNKIYYNGKIYCVSVPNEIIFVRRNGKCLWTGNSYKLQKYINALSGGQKPNLLFEGHYHKALYMFYRNIHGFEAGTLQDQTIFMKKKQTPAMLGFWGIDVQGKDGNVSRIKSEFIPYFE